MSRPASRAGSDSASSVNVDDEINALATHGVSAGNAEAQRFLTALLESQLRVGELKARVKVLETENYELKLKAAKKSGAARGKSKASSPMPSSSVNSAAGSISSARNSAPAPDQVAVSVIRRFGRYAQLECTPLLPASAFGEPKPKFRHDSPDRYLDGNIAHGFTTDVYHCVPVEYHEKIRTGSESFRTCFFEGFSGEVANSILTLRSVSGELTGVQQAIFRSNDPRADGYVSRATIPRIRDLLGITTKKETNANGEVVMKDTYAEYPPFLFPPGHVDDFKMMFQNPLMFQFAKAVIFGKTKINHPRPTLRKGATYRHDDGRPLQASSGNIAWFATLIQYCLSPDTEFGGKGVGDITGIDYGIKHALYRRLLIEGRTKKAIARTIRLWNENVFAATKASDSEESVPDSEEDRIETRRQARYGAQPGGVMHNILAKISDSESDSEDPALDKGKGVDRDATFTMESLSIDAPTRPSSPRSEGNDTFISHRAVHGGDTLLEDALDSEAVVNSEAEAPISRRALHAGYTLIEDFDPVVENPYHVASADLTDVLSARPQVVSKPQPPLSHPKPVSRRPVIVSGRHVSKAANPVLAGQPIVPDSISANTGVPRRDTANAVSSDVPTPVAAVVAPAPRRTSNRGKAAGTSDPPTGQGVEQSSMAVRGRGGKAAKKARGA